jgi:acetate kinase
MAAILDWMRGAGFSNSVAAVGHRVVHGGPDLAEPMLVDDAALTVLRRLNPLAPLQRSPRGQDRRHRGL